MDISPIQTKSCTQCGEVKPINDFYKSRKSKDGYQSHCKDCHRELNRESTKRAYAKRRVNSEHHGNLPIRGNEDSPLRDFTPRELIEELKARGYHGELHFDYKVTL